MSQKTSRVGESLKLLATWFLAFVRPIVLVHVFTILMLATIIRESILFALFNSTSTSIKVCKLTSTHNVVQKSNARKNSGIYISSFPDRFAAVPRFACVYILVAAKMVLVGQARTYRLPSRVDLNGADGLSA